jgi:raffinose/stachyose/melibiose transport system substrate-binding protein
MRRLTLIALVALLAGCGAPGEDAPEPRAAPDEKKVDVAAAGPVTLTVWDQEVRGGQRRQIQNLNEAFQAKYPNITIKRVAKSFTDLNTTLKLAVSGDKAPDVVQANQGHQVMGTLVKGGLLAPLDGYADAYGWADRYSPVLLELNSFTADGETYGEGDLYGLSQMGEIVGLFYNREKVPQPPATFADFEAQLADAKQAGEVPISFGNLDKWPGIHEFQAVQNAYASPDQIRDFVFGREGGSFATPENAEAAAKLREWAEAGYFTKNFNGVGYDPAYQQFADGAGPFLIAGTWLLSDLSDAMGDNVGFMLVPGQDGAEPQALGGESLPWAITSKSENPDVAAAYIDFITDANAADVLVRFGNLPAMPSSTQLSGAAGEDVFEAWRTLNDANGLVPYLDYATPTFFDDLSGAVQRLMAGRLAAGAFTEDLQGDFEKFSG